MDKIGEADARAADLSAAIDSANRAYPSGTLTLNSIGNELAELNDLRRARSLARMLKQGDASTLLSSMARSQAKKGSLGPALRTAAQIQNLEIRSYALEEIALRQGLAGDYSQARKILALARLAHQKGLFDSDDLEMIIVTNQLTRGEKQQARRTIDSWTDGDRKFSALLGGAEQLRQQGDKISAVAWLQDGLQQLSSEPSNEFFRYWVIPIEVKLGEKERAMEAAGALSPDMRVKAYMAVAVTCAEERDVVCVDAAIEKMSKTSNSENGSVSDFVLKMMTLNVTAALIDNDQFEAASRWLLTIEQNVEDFGPVKPQIQLQRAFMLGQQGKFRDAREVALTIRPDSITEVERGEALRLTALVQTKANGADSTTPWATALTDSADRAYALLGIAQALLNTGEVKLPYSAIQVH